MNKHGNLRILLCFFCTGLMLTCISPSRGQLPDSISPGNLTHLTDQLEFISRSSPAEVDLTGLAEEYLHYIDNPVNLNGDGKRVLVELGIISAIQYRALTAYQERLGPLRTLYELKHIEGFDAETIRRMTPFVSAGPTRENSIHTGRKIFSNARHQIIARYGQVIEKSKGYRSQPNTGALPSSGTYLGKRFSSYLRYAASFSDRIRLGITLDRDAGELFGKSSLGDSLRQLIGSKVSNYVDFISGFVYVSDLGLLKQAVVGDYHLEFGQGLTLWSGVAFGISADPIQVVKHGRGIKPNTASNENRFFRGGAVTLGWWRLAFTAFYSANRIDATILKGIDREWVTGMPDFGKHRTVNELLAKDALAMRCMGGRLAFVHDHYQVGITALDTRLSLPFERGPQVYRHFHFEGSKLTNLGADWRISLARITIFGEMARALPGGMAGLAGISLYPADRVTLTFLYRDLGNVYHNFFSEPFRAGSQVNQERGLYVGIKLLLASFLTVNISMDHYNHTWLRYQKDFPSWGREYMIQFDMLSGRPIDLYLRYRFRDNQENIRTDYLYTARAGNTQKHECRLHFTYSVLGSLWFGNRIEYVFSRSPSGAHETGFMIYHDLRYRSERSPISLTARICLFDTGGNESGIYVYEHDLRYAFSVPSFSGSGIRYFLLIGYKPVKVIDIGMRFSRTGYLDREMTGSGADEIEGNRKTEVRAQVIIKF